MFIYTTFELHTAAWTAQRANIKVVKLKGHYVVLDEKFKLMKVIFTTVVR